jgi:hypothetical protein
MIESFWRICAKRYSRLLEDDKEYVESSEEDDKDESEDA